MKSELEIKSVIQGEVIEPGIGDIDPIKNPLGVEARVLRDHWRLISEYNASTLERGIFHRLDAIGYRLALVVESLFPNGDQQPSQQNTDL